jgi:ribosomal protein L12E/L44/L45/RPP1/RPP2
MIYDWVRNSAAVIKKGYPRAVAVYAEYNKVQMTAFPELKDQDIDAILGYINTGGAKAAAPAAAPAGGGTSSTALDQINDEYEIKVLASSWDFRNSVIGKC